MSTKEELERLETAALKAEKAVAVYEASTEALSRKNAEILDTLKSEFKVQSVAEAVELMAKLESDLYTSIQEASHYLEGA